MKRSVERIAKAFTELLEQKPYNRITVRDIVERSGLHRNTFYYHFQDIPALLSYLGERYITRVTGQEAEGIGSPLDCAEPMLDLLSSRKKLVLNLYQSSGREILMEKLRKASRLLMERYISVTPDGIILEEEDHELLADYYSSAVIGWLIEWMDRQMEYDMPAHIRRLRYVMEKMGRPAYAQQIAEIQWKQKERKPQFPSDAEGECAAE